MPVWLYGCQGATAVSSINDLYLVLVGIVSQKCSKSLEELLQCAAPLLFMLNLSSAIVEQPAVGCSPTSKAAAHVIQPEPSMQTT